MLLPSHGHHPIAEWKLEATQPQQNKKASKIHQSTKYTKKSKVDGTLPMLFFDFYKHFGQNMEMIGHVSKEPCIPRIPNDAHLAIL